MDAPPQSYYDRVSAGIVIPREARPQRVFKAGDADPQADTVALHRERISHRGVGRLGCVRTLLAYNVDQGYFDELCELEQLECLYLESVTAADLSAIARLGSLQRLIINGATRIQGLEWIASLGPAVRSLAIEHAPRVSPIEPLTMLTRLTALAVERSLNADMHVSTLQPLANLQQLEYLFLTALRVDDKGLAPLQSLKSLKVLDFADRYARGEIDALAAALPETRCPRFEERMRRHRWECRAAASAVRN